jgi:glycosyltransferase involved in cell wall biosynthesis
MIKGTYEPHGGTESVISGFLDYMDYGRFRPHLAMLSKPGAGRVPPLLKDPDRVPQRAVRWPGTLGAMSAARQLARLVDEWQIDLVHTHDHRSTLAARLLMHYRPLPWVSHMHGWLGKTGILLNQFHEAVAKRLQRRADIVIGGSAHTCSEVEHLGMRKLYVLPNGIAIPSLNEVAVAAKAIRGRLGVGEDTILCGVTARLHPGKGHAYLFDACKRLRDAGHDLRVLVVGDGDHRPALEQAARDLGITPFVHFAGRVPQVLDYLAAMDIFVLPSLKESLSIAVLEAMAARRPVVTTRVGDFHTLISHGTNGMLVTPGDAQALAEGVEPLLHDPALRGRMAEAGQQTVRDRFSIQAMVRAMEGYYLEAIADAQSRRYVEVRPSKAGQKSLR